MTISFTAYGIPAPKGSTKAFIPKGWNRAIVTETNKHTRPWAAIVKGAAIDAVKDVHIAFPEGPISIDLRFLMPRPVSLPKKVVHHTKKPDCDKLVRAILDALKGIIWSDDSQVVEIRAQKFYAREAERPGVSVIVKEYAADAQATIPSQCITSQGVTPEVRRLF